MTRDMGHDAASELLAGAAFDALTAGEQAAVLAHAATCPECGPAFAELQAALGALGAGVPLRGGADVERRIAGVRVRVLARARADRAPLGEGAPRRRRWRDVALLAAAALIVAWVVVRGRDRLTSALAAAERAAAGDSAALDSARHLLASRDREIQALTGANTLVVALSTNAAPAATALMFWNRGDNTWSFFAHRLASPPSGRTYQLWLVTPSAQISAGTFTPGPDGSAEVHATYALPADSLRAVAVTLEPAGGVARATGPVVIVGAPKIK